MSVEPYLSSPSDLINAKQCSDSSESQVSCSDDLVTGIIGGEVSIRTFINSERKREDDQISLLQSKVDDLQKQFEALKNDMSQPISLPILAENIDTLIRTHCNPPANTSLNQDASLKRDRNSSGKRWSTVSANSVDSGIGRTLSFGETSVTSSILSTQGSHQSAGDEGSHQSAGDDETLGEQSDQRIKQQDSFSSDIDSINLDNITTSIVTSTPAHGAAGGQLNNIKEQDETQEDNGTNTKSFVLQNTLLAMKELVNMMLLDNTPHADSAESTCAT